MELSPQFIGWASLIGMFVLIGLGIPVAFAITSVGFVGYYLLAGSEPALGIIGFVLYTKTGLYAFTAVPLFLAMGNLAFHSGFGGDIFHTARQWVGRFPGGLAQATVAGSAAFGAACGSGIASCAMLTKVSVPEMTKHGYDKRLAFGCAGAAGPIAQMIPPSIMMVLYGILTEVSVAKLLIAGIVPGIVCTLSYMFLIYGRVKWNPALAPPPERVPIKEALISTKGSWPIAALALLVMGGIYAGIFTPTEAGGIGAFGTLALGFVMKRFRWGDITSAFFDTAKTTSMLYLIISGSYVFGYLLTITGLPTQLSELLTGLEVSRFVVLGLIMVFYLIIGCFIDLVPAMFITLPMIFPTIVKLGFNPIWFGVLIVQLGEISLLTPPFGLNLFVMKGLIPGVSMSDIIRGVFPFVITAAATLLIYIIFPEITLFLPNLMLGE